MIREISREQDTSENGDELQDEARYTNERYPEILANFKIETKVRKLQEQRGLDITTKRDDGNKKENNSLTNKVVTKRNTSTMDQQRVDDIEDGLRNIISKLGLNEDNNLNLNKREASEDETEDREALREDEDLESGSNRIDIMKESPNKARKKKEGKGKKAPKKKNNTQKEENKENNDNSDKLEQTKRATEEINNGKIIISPDKTEIVNYQSEGEAYLREKRQGQITTESSDLIKGLETSGELTVSGNKSPLASTIEESDSNLKSQTTKKEAKEKREDKGYDIELEKNIQEQINAIKEQVKREIEAIKFKETEKDAGEEHTNLKRKKRDAKNTLLDEEEEAIDPKLNNELSLKPHKRNKRDFAGSSDEDINKECTTVVTLIDKRSVDFSKQNLTDIALTKRENNAKTTAVVNLKKDKKDEVSVLGKENEKPVSFDEFKGNAENREGRNIQLHSLKNIHNDSAITSDDLSSSLRESNEIFEKLRERSNDKSCIKENEIFQRQANANEEEEEEDPLAYSDQVGLQNEYQNNDEEASVKRETDEINRQSLLEENERQKRLEKMEKTKKENNENCKEETSNETEKGDSGRKDENNRKKRLSMTENKSNIQKPATQYNEEENVQRREIRNNKSEENIDLVPSETIEENNIHTDEQNRRSRDVSKIDDTELKEQKTNAETLFENNDSVDESQKRKRRDISAEGNLQNNKSNVLKKETVKNIVNSEFANQKIERTKRESNKNITNQTPDTRKRRETSTLEEKDEEDVKGNEEEENEDFERKKRSIAKSGETVAKRKLETRNRREGKPAIIESVDKIKVSEKIKRRETKPSNSKKEIKKNIKDEDNRKRRETKNSKKDVKKTKSKKGGDARNRRNISIRNKRKNYHEPLFTHTRKKRSNGLIGDNTASFLAYRDEDEEVDDEGDEFDDDGFDDRTSSIVRKRDVEDQQQSDEENLVENEEESETDNRMKKRQNFLHNYVSDMNSDTYENPYAKNYLYPRSYTRHKRQDLDDDYAMLHGGGGSTANRHQFNIEQRNNRKKRLEGKHLDSKNVLDLTDSDLFGALPQSYEGELSRYKRVKRSLSNQNKGE